MIIGPPPDLILPDYWRESRPAIIRPAPDVVQGAIPFGAFRSGVQDPQLSYRGAFTRGSTASAATHTIANVDFGTANSNRVVVITMPPLKADMTSVTIGGVSATVEQTSSGKGTGLAWALVPTGTSGSVVLNANAATTDNSTVYVHTFIGNPTALDVRKAVTAAGTSTITISDLIVQNGGVLIYHMYKLDNTNVIGFSYTGIDTPVDSVVVDNAQQLKRAVITETVSTNDIIVTRPTSMTPYIIAATFQGL